MKKLLLIICGLISTNTFAQNTFYPINSYGYKMSERCINTGFQNSINNITREKNRLLYLNLEKDSLNENKETRRNNRYESRYLFEDNFSNSIENSNRKTPIYVYPSAFYAIKGNDYIFVVNPVLNFSGGKEQATTKTLFQNTRGAEIFGNIGGLQKGIGFYSYFTENQVLMPNAYNFYPDSLNFMPNELFFKPFKKQGAIDFFQARAYITFNAAKNYVKFQFGHDKHNIGKGYRSLILSDFAPQYLFLKINTDVKRVHYQNLFTQFNDNGPILGNTLFGKKYAAFHRLSFDVRKNLNIGLTEMVIFDRKDSTQSNQFDFNYLNPVIFYRAVESNLGSRDNSMMALDFDWRVKNKFLFYGQFVLDEFNLKFLKTKPNWWGNKYAYQLGAKYYNMFNVKYLDGNLEYNRCRPYTYSHYRPTQSFSHFNQSLAHPLGANFSELIFQLRYQVNYRLSITLNNIFAVSGKDSFLNGRNYGGNILRNYNSRATENNSTLLMGKRTSLMINDLMVSYMYKHNLFLDLRINHRKENTISNIFVSLGLRLNANYRQYDF